MPIHNDPVDSTDSISPKLYHKIKQQIGTVPDAEDMLQEAYLRYVEISRKRSSERRRCPERYLRLLVSNAMSRWADKEKRFRMKIPINVLANAEDTTWLPDEIVNAYQELGQVVRQIQRMPDRARQVFTLSTVYTYSDNQIAARLAIPYAMVKRHRQSVRAHLMRELRPSLAKLNPRALKLYDISKGIQPNTIIADIAPKIVVASAALAERLKREPQSVYSLPPRQFELLIAELLEDLGYRVEITQATRDGGRDLLAYLKTELGTLLCLVEAKKYRHDRKVGVELVRALYGTLIDAQANQAMLVTTSSFTRDAREFRHRHRYQIALKDYADLEHWIREYGNRAVTSRCSPASYQSARLLPKQSMENRRSSR